MPHAPRMKLALFSIAVCAMSFALTSCGNSGGGRDSGLAQQPGIGPFDSRGNYVEELADSPSKWRKAGGYSSRPAQPDPLPEVAQNDQPPMNSVPLVTRNTTQVTAIRETQVVRTSPPPTRTRSNSDDDDDEKPVVKSSTKTKSKAEPEREVARAKKKPKADSDDEVATTKSKSKTVAKTKSKSSRYTVKQGDSLSSIASRNGTSVSALKRENGISGTLIRPGQALTIPR